jgi:hypothetical protein
MHASPTYSNRFIGGSALLEGGFESCCVGSVPCKKLCIWPCQSRSGASSWSSGICVHGAIIDTVFGPLAQAPNHALVLRSNTTDFFTVLSPLLVYLSLKHPFALADLSDRFRLLLGDRGFLPVPGLLDFPGSVGATLSVDSADEYGDGQGCEAPAD